MQIVYHTSINGRTGFGYQGLKYAEELAKRTDKLYVMHDNQGPKTICPNLLKAVQKGPMWSGDVCLMNDNPLGWIRNYGERFKKHIGYMVFEGDKAPEMWADELNNPSLDMVFVPSEVAKRILIESEIAPDNVDKIKVIPHGIDPEIYNTEVTPADLDMSNDTFKFLYVGGWAQGENDRKGANILLEAFFEEFNKEDDVTLVFKVNTIYNPNVDIKKEIDNIINKHNYKDRAPIHLITDDMQDVELARLYKACDCFTMATMGEAFCMPILEASACGLPTIVTRNPDAGYMDFTEELGSYYCENKGLRPAGLINGHIYDGVNWVEPDKDSLKKMMRFVFDNREIAKKVGSTAAEIVKNNWTWKHAVDKMIKHMED